MIRLDLPDLPEGYVYVISKRAVALAVPLSGETDVHFNDMVYGEERHRSGPMHTEVRVTFIMAKSWPREPEAREARLVRQRELSAPVRQLWDGADSEREDV